MIPRLKSSKKWTSLPAEFCAQIESAVRQNFAAFLGDHEVEVQGRIYPEEILLHVGLIRPGVIRQANFEASMAFEAHKEKAIEKVYVAMDLMGLMIDQYLRQFDSELADSGADDLNDWPRYWQAEKLNGHEVFIQFSTANTRLEAEADRLLGLDSESSLVRVEDSETEIPDNSDDVTKEAPSTVH